MRRLASLLAALLLALCGAAAAEEAILGYDQHVAVGADGVLDVTETITVRAEGRDIRRGIFRDFPLYFEDGQGRRQEVGFDFEGATLNGAPVPSRLEWTRTGVRIYLGDPERFLPSGTHSYRLSYETSRQIRFFDDHDELYWNVTGNEWAFPIERARVEVVLPGGSDALAPAPKRLLAFTGPVGAQGEDYRARVTDTGAVVETTRRLGPGEGLTIVAGLRKGVVAPPSATETFWYEHRGQILAAGGVLLVLGYYLWAWNRVGRDPRRGVVIPLFSAPKGVSPALANYIHHKGFSDAGWTALSATCVDLAVKGHLTFEDLSGKVRLEPTGKAVGRDLVAGEREVATWFADQRRPLTLSKAEGTRVQALGSLHRTAIERENRGKFYLRNGGHSAFGVLLSIAAAAAMLVFGGFGEDDFLTIPVALFATVWLGVAAAGIGALLKRLGLRSGTGYNLLATLAVVAAVGWIVDVFAGATGLAADRLLPGALIALVAVNGLFLWLMGAPTLEGRALMDKIEGLKMYLSVAEADRMNMAGAPEMTPTRYETLLPYAIALGVEKPWTAAFNAWLATAAAGAAAAAYQPGWYHGDGFSSGRGFSDTVTDDLGRMAQSFASSLPTPKSSSSGFSSGGGGSGGGRGGGGGGGW